MIVLAVESSCDETAVAILEAPRKVHASVVHSQIDLHRPYGGIVPEIASRAHAERLTGLYDQALAEAGATLRDIDLVASTRGPGLLGALLVGMNFAQGLALVTGKPFVGVNHLHGHLLSPDLDEAMRLPALVLLVTGGHTALYRLETETEATLLRRTADDAVGEAFDKIAKMLGLPYPGGPAVEQLAEQGDPAALDFPIPHPRDPTAMSLSGLKTAVRREIEARGAEGRGHGDIAAAFQRTVGELLGGVLKTALAENRDVEQVYLVGGVAQNVYLRTLLEEACYSCGAGLFAPDPRWCGDNAAMIARAAVAQFHSSGADALDGQPLGRWEFGTWA